MRGAISFAASVSLDASTGPFFARQKTEFSEASQAYFSAPFRHARKKFFFACKEFSVRITNAIAVIDR